MKTTVFSIALLVISSAIYISCSSTVSGGTGTETVNTFAMLPDGSPAAGATLSIVEARCWVDSISQGRSPVIKKIMSDKRGFFEFNLPEDHQNLNIQIDHTDKGLVIALPAGSRLLADTLHLKPYASYSGILDTDSSSAMEVLISGTSYRTTVSDNGEFEFPGVAPGIYSLVVCTPNNTIAGVSPCNLEPGSVSYGDTIEIANRRLIIDNFECGVGPTSLNSLIPGFAWYVLSDSLYYLWSNEEWAWKEKSIDPIATSWISFDSVPDGNGGKAFRFSTVLDRVSMYANALVGFSFKPVSENGADLSAMTGFSLRASGSGTIRIHFETYYLDSASDMGSHYAYPLELTPTMTEYTIPVDSLRIIEPVSYAANHPWSREAKRVNRIEFVFAYGANNRGDTLTCTFDDFTLEGVPASSVINLCSQ